MNEYKDVALDAVKDLVAAYLYHDRKGDEELTPAHMQELIEKGTLTHAEIVAAFSQHLAEAIKSNFPDATIPLKRFMLFTYYEYYPVGGMGDFQGSYDTVQEAHDSRPRPVFECWEILDTHTGKRFIPE